MSKTKKGKENIDEIIDESESDSESDYDEPFVARDDSIIYFGKFKGQPHSVLLEPENKKYARWILKLKEFGEVTKTYLNSNGIKLRGKKIE